MIFILGAYAHGVELLAGLGGRACGTLADIRLSGTSRLGAVQVLSCDCFWWDFARGETRGLIRAALPVGRAWIPGGLRSIGA